MKLRSGELALIIIALGSTPAWSIAGPGAFSQPYINCYSAFSGIQHDAVEARMQDVVKELAKYMSVPSSLELCETNDDQIAFADFRSKQRIIYNRNMMIGIFAIDKDQYDLALYILSYPLQMIYSGMLDGDSKTVNSQVRMRVEVDERVGYIIGKAGRRPDSMARLIGLTFKSSFGSHDASVKQRLSAFERGWRFGHSDAAWSDLMRHYYQTPANTLSFGKSIVLFLKEFAALLTAITAVLGALYGGYRWLAAKRTRNSGD